MTKEQAKTLAKALVIPHTTGKQKEGNFIHHGYFTKEDGKGKKTEHTPISAGKGIYYDRDKLNDQEIDIIKEHNFVRLQNARTTKTVLSIRALRNATNSAYKWSDDQADKILSTLRNELAALESDLLKVQPDKDEKKGYQFSL